MKNSKLTDSQKIDAIVYAPLELFVIVVVVVTLVILFR